MRGKNLMNFKLLSVFATATLLSLGGLVAFANTNSLSRIPNHQEISQTLAQNPNPQQGKPRPRQGGQGPMGPGMIQDLNLTPEQQVKMREIRSQNYEQIAKTRDELQAAREKLRTMLAGSDSPDAIRNQHNQVLALTQNLATLNFESLLQMREVLDSSQRAKFSQMMNAGQRGNRQGGNPGNLDPEF
jgi:Spy/CpxP family protein refolding chaperone